MATQRARMNGQGRVGVMVLLGLAATAGCGGDDDGMGTSAIDTTDVVEEHHDADEHEAVDFDGEPADEATRAEVVAEVAAAFTEVRSGPARIELEMDEEGRPSTASIRVDPPSGLLESTWVQETRRGTEITTRNIVIDGRTFLKGTAGAEAEAAVDFVEVGASTGAKLLENVFTAYGRIAPSLDRLLLFVESLPFDVAIERDGEMTRTRISIDPDDIVQLYAATGLETTSAVATDESVLLEFVTDGGLLTAIEASGTQFHDGEALHLRASLSFRPILPFELTAPELGG